MKNECEQLKENIIHRVNRIYFWRTYTRPVVIESVILAGLLSWAFCMVSISHIVANAYSTRSISGFSRFAIGVFENTEFSLKALSLAVGVLALLIARDMFGGLSVFTRKIRSSFS